jgi:hypothetical protein
VGAHVVVYRLEDQGIGVVRILHQRMSLAFDALLAKAFSVQHAADVSRKMEGAPA